MANIFVQNTHGMDINVLDEDDGCRQIGRIALGPNIQPDYLFLSKDGSLLYTDWCDASWRNHDFEGAARSYFTAHDARTFAEVWRVEFDASANHYALHPSGRYAFISIYDRQRIMRLDLETREIAYAPVHTMAGHGIKCSKDGRFCYGSSVMSGDFWEVDCQTMELKRTFGFPHGVRPFALSSDGQYAYIQISHLHGFHKFNLKDWRVERTITLPEPPGMPKESRYPFTIDHGIGITPDQRYLVCLGTMANEVNVLDYKTYELVKSIKVGTQPSYLIFNPAGTRVYVTSRKTHELHVIDLDTLEIVHHVRDVGNYPQRVCVG